MSGSSGSKERRHKTERHAQNQSADEDPPSPPSTSFLEQKFGIPVWWLPAGIVEKGRLWLSQSGRHRTTITSTMFPVKIDRSDTMALHDQVAAEIRRAIADGEAGPGERLPLAKDIAAVLGVNKNTVLRALHILREEGLLDFQRGRGITVAGTPQHGAVVKRIRDLVEFSRSQGYRRDEVIAMIESLP